MNRHLQCPFGHSQLCCGISMARGVLRSAQEVLHAVEESGLAGGGVLLPQLGQNPLEKRDGPTAGKGFISCVGVNRLAAETTLGGREIQRNAHASCASLACPRVIAMIREKVPERCRQIRAEAAFRAVGGGKVVSGEQPREKLLRQILRVVRREALRPDAGIQRIPVRPAQRFERRLRLRRRIPSCRHDEAPMRRREFPRRRLRRARL